jgi:ribosomal-protein-alanine N-acetyltransferase
METTAMETMPYDAEMDAMLETRQKHAAAAAAIARTLQSEVGAATTGDPTPPKAPSGLADAAREGAWRDGLPVLTGTNVTLRELRQSDAASLFELLTTEEVARFISPPPTTVEGFERFIAWAIRQREAGEYLCFAVVPEGLDTAVGIFQVRQLEPGMATAEWGFALGSAFWGTGLFLESARLVVDFSFETLGVHRLEARASVLNGRGNGALTKIGAVREATLRRSFERDGVHHDQSLWAILEDDWRQSKAVWGKAVWGNAVSAKAVWGPKVH